MSIALADVSEFQYGINWAAYGAANPAVIVRVHNSNRSDNYAKANIAGARSACSWRGWYQYLTAGADPTAAAHAFQATLGPTLPGEVMILDLEEGAGDQRGRRAAWLAALQDPIEWVYSGLYFARTHLPGTHVEWLAAYGQGEPTDAHTLWQNTNARRFAGITNPCDGSLFNGTIADLIALTHGGVEDMDANQATQLAYIAKIVGVALDTKGQIIQGELLTRVRSIDVHTVTPSPTADAIAIATAAKVTAIDVNALATALAPKLNSASTPTEIAAAVRDILATQPLH